MAYTDRPDLYDLRHAEPIGPGELAFYRALAREASTPVVELGFGTGRVGLALAREGISVIGVDLSPSMLERAREKLHAEPIEVRQRVQLVQASMTDFQLEQRVGLVYVPFSAFLHLTTQPQQRACLKRVREHLTPGGRWAGSFFRPDPARLVYNPHERLDAFRDGVMQSSWDRHCDPHEQVKKLLLRFQVHGPDGRVRETVTNELELGWIWGREWRLLLELEGFELERLDGGFEQEPIESSWQYVWVARRG